MPSQKERKTLKALLKILDIGPGKLAKEIEFSKAQVIRVLSGKRSASPKFKCYTRIAIEEALRQMRGISEIKLFDEEDQR